MRHYDCCVIGTGPAGQKAAIQAAKLGKRVVVVEKNPALGGAAINTGTIPSKALREAVLHLTGATGRSLYGDSMRARKQITIADLIYVSQQVIHHEIDLIRTHLVSNGIEVVIGAARFDSPEQVTVDTEDGTEQIKADYFFLAVGTRPAMPANVPFDDAHVFTSDGLLKIGVLPRSLIVVGGGVIGTEYACMMATLGVKVTVVEGRRQVLGFLDNEITEAFQYHMRQTGITLRLGEKVSSIERINREHDAKGPPTKLTKPKKGEPEGATEETPEGTAAGDGSPFADAHAAAGLSTADSPHRPCVQATLESGKILRAEALLYAVGREGVTGKLGLANCGLKVDDRERLKVNEHYQTDVSHIYAMGDVIGFPALASTAMEQGRLAVCHAYGVPVHTLPEVYPFGIYAIPEISMVGKTEEQLTQAGIPYEAGVALYKEVARGQLLGDDTGMLKLLIHQEDHTLLGIHAIGTGATELIHIGQAVMALKGKVDYFIHNVFNFPTLAEAYKVAALNGLNKLRHI